MPQGFDYRDATTWFSPQPTMPAPGTADRPLAPHHPYPGWMPEGRGDPMALMPWIDDDLREQHEAEPESPVLTAIERAHNGHTLFETATKGGESIHAAFGEEMEAIFEGTASKTKIAGAAAEAVMAPVAIAGGIMDVADGVREWRAGNKLDGGLRVVEGVGGSGSGVAGLASLAGVNAVTPWGMGLAAGAAGMKVGRYGDKQVKELGWLHDDEGNALSGSEWAGHLGRATNDWFTDRGHPYLGAVAGGGALVGGILANAGIAPAAAAVGYGHELGTYAANQHRASVYDHYDVHVVGGGQSLADYDDARDAAIERSKREHPERWGHNPNNPTFGQWFATTKAQLEKTGGSK